MSLFLIVLVSKLIESLSSDQSSLQIENDNMLRTIIVHMRYLHIEPIHIEPPQARISSSLNPITTEPLPFSIGNKT
jgi:hypothetical protein